MQQVLLECYLQPPPCLVGSGNRLSLSGPSAAREPPLRAVLGEAGPVCASLPESEVSWRADLSPSLSQMSPERHSLWFVDTLPLSPRNLQCIPGPQDRRPPGAYHQGMGGGRSRNKGEGVREATGQSPH